MTIIHMDTDNVSTLVTKLKNIADLLTSKQNELNYLIQGLDWKGNSRDEYCNNINSVQKNMVSICNDIDNLSIILQKEIDQWLQESKGLGDGILFKTGLGDLMPIHPSDISQGSLGDCYLMASLAALAAANPQAIKDMIISNQDGSFTVRFFNEKTGKAEYVIVRKEDLALNKSGNPLYAEYGDNGELWPAIIEKGYAQWIDERNTKDPFFSRAAEFLGFEGKDDYKLIEGGWPQDALQHFTGKVSTVYEPATNFSELNLIDCLEQGKPITVGTLNPLQTGIINKNPLYHGDSAVLVENHAYYITGYDKVTGMVELRNPWGWNHEQGLVMIPLSELQSNIRLFATNEVI